jgi:hypothetical protein
MISVVTTSKWLFAVTHRILTRQEWFQTAHTVASIDASWDYVDLAPSGYMSVYQLLPSLTLPPCSSYALFALSAIFRQRMTNWMKIP